MYLSKCHFYLATRVDQVQLSTLLVYVFRRGKLLLLVFFTRIELGKQIYSGIHETAFGHFLQHLVPLFWFCWIQLQTSTTSFANLGSGFDDEKSLLMSQMSLEKRFGQSAVFVASTLMENGGVPQSATPETLLKEAIHVISCGYEDKTDWGSEVCFLAI